MFAPSRAHGPANRRLAGLSTRWPGKDKDRLAAVEDPDESEPSRPAPAPSFLSILCASALAATYALADPVGSVTRLPLPRFASLKTDRVNLREGPSKDHADQVGLRARRTSARNHRRV